MFARAALVALALAACATAASAQDDAQAAWAAQCADWDEWDKPGPPFKVFGNTYYVGTCGIASILIVGDQGNVLIDSGTKNGADLIAANIRALGFDPRDVKLLLMTHEHHDHTGGMARIEELTGATLVTTPRAAKAMEAGAAIPDDPQFDEHNTFPPAQTQGVVLDGVPLWLGSLGLMPMETPGHTPGALTWQWHACEGADCRAMVYADSLTPVSSDSYRFADHPAYLAEFRRSLTRVAQLDCDILLSPHPSASGMRERLLAGGVTDPSACRAYAQGLETRLDERLAKEADGE